MAWESRLGLKRAVILLEQRSRIRLNGLGSPSGIETLRVTTVALVEEEEEASPPGSANQKAAMAGELAKPLRPAPTPQSLALASEPAAESSRGCGYVDAPARPHGGRATHDAP